MVLIILSLCILINITILCILAKRWKKIQKFFHDENYTYFEILFISFYFLEQAVFIALSYFYPEYNRLLVGFFALLVLTTVSLNKIMMESRNRKLSEYVNEYFSKFKLTKEEYEKRIREQSQDLKVLEEENKALIDYIKKRPKSKK